MEEKKCRVCGETKPLTEFDKSKSCSDGHRCICKKCRLEQTRRHKEEMRKDPSYVEEERRKAREKYRRYKEEGRIKPSRTPNGMNVAIQLKRRGFDMTGKEAHHWNYNYPKSVFIMSRNAHEAIHRHLRVDYDSKMTYTKEGVLLETAEQAKEFFAKVLVSEGINEETQYVDFSNNLSLIESSECRDIESFKKKAYEKFGNRFNYDKCEYKGYETPMLIYCDKHGYFEQSPNDHLRSRHGCPRCAVDSVISKEKYTTEEFIRKAKLKHGDRYTYDHTVYIGSRERVIVTCREHGDFVQNAANHLKGNGCPMCRYEKLSEKKKKSQEQFIEDARKVHGDYYDYSLVEYHGCFTKVKIICPKHGLFEQTPSTHLSGSGCPVCRKSKGEERVALWLKENNILHKSQYKIQNDFVFCANKNIIVDFYLPEHNTIVEYNGEQHYHSVNLWGRTRKV